MVDYGGKMPELQVHLCALMASMRKVASRLSSSIFSKEHAADAVYNLSTQYLHIYKILICRHQTPSRKSCEEEFLRILGRSIFQLVTGEVGDMQAGLENYLPKIAQASINLFSACDKLHIICS